VIDIRRLPLGREALVVVLGLANLIGGDAEGVALPGCIGGALGALVLRIAVLVCALGLSGERGPQAIQDLPERFEHQSTLTAVRASINRNGLRSAIDRAAATAALEAHGGQKSISVREDWLERLVLRFFEQRIFGPMRLDKLARQLRTHDRDQRRTTRLSDALN